MDKLVLTPYEVAERLGISLRLVYRQIQKGVIPSVKCGDKYLIGRKAFDRWLDGDSSAPEYPAK